MYRVGIITASDKGSRGERVDESGAKIKEIVGEFSIFCKICDISKFIYIKISNC